MVRLRVHAQNITLTPKVIFQFLHGAIKGIGGVLNIPVPANFNSYMVRLRAGQIPKLGAIVVISIPTWCD